MFLSRFYDTQYGKTEMPPDRLQISSKCKNLWYWGIGIVRRNATPQPQSSYSLKVDSHCLWECRKDDYVKQTGWVKQLKTTNKDWTNQSSTKYEVENPWNNYQIHKVLQTKLKSTKASLSISTQWNGRYKSESPCLVRYKNSHSIVF